MRRFLKANHRTEVPRHHVAFDTETVPVPSGHGNGACTHKLMIGRAVYWEHRAGRVTRERWLTFTHERTFWDWVYSLAMPGRCLWVWAHNLAFDMSVVRIWQELECRTLLLSTAPECSQVGPGQKHGSGRWKGALCTEDPPTYIHAKTAQGASLKLCDSLNWIMAPLAELGKMLRLDKLDMPGEAASDADWLAYCARDVEILQRAVCKLLDTVREEDLGCLRYTAASQSMQLFRHLPGHEQVAIDDRPEIKALERQSYHGPRCEVYYSGACIAFDRCGLENFMGVKERMPCLTRGPVYRLDLNAAYPSVMRDNLFPVAYDRALYQPSPADLLGHMRASCACADVTLDTGCDCYPVRTEKRTLWALGKFRTQLCGPELLRALQSGAVKAVHTAQIYTAGRPFAAFVDKVLGWRSWALCSGDKFGAKLAKVIANALHGKFAQRGHRWELLPGEKSIQPWGVGFHRDPETGAVVTRRYVGWNVQEERRGEESDDSFPLIAAYTTCYHREAMRAAVTVAGLRDVLYEDADSLHVTQAGFDMLQRRNLIHDSAPGKFKVTGVAQVAVYHGLRHYQMDGERTCAGLARKRHVDARGLWCQDKFLSLDAMLAHGMPAGPVSYEEHNPEPSASLPGRTNADGWVDPPIVGR